MTKEKQKKFEELQNRRNLIKLRSKAGEIPYLTWAEMDAALLVQMADLQGIERISLRRDESEAEA